MKTFIFIIFSIIVTGDDSIESQETRSNITSNNSVENQETFVGPGPYETNNNSFENHDENNEPIPMDIDIFAREIINSDPRTYLTPRIVGGDNAEVGMFPSQVAVLIYKDRSTRYYFCGGVLIHPCFVLTAAHCCDSAIRFEIRLGATNFRIKEPSQIRMNSTTKMLHPGWNNRTLENDMCMIKLPNCIHNSTDFIRPIKICNKTKSELLGCPSTISGWGRISDNSTYVNNYLRYISVPIIPTCGYCKTIYSLVFSKNICTSSDQGMSPCNGDSGGPMLISDDDGNDCLCGIVSYGHVKGCQRGFPAVQTFVPCYTKWIAKVIHYYEPEADECPGACEDYDHVYPIL